MSTCANSVSCDCADKKIFRTERIVLPTVLSGLVWAMPITETGDPFVWPTSNGGCQNPPDQVTKMVGLPGKLYNVTCLIRGIIELAQYSGGSVVGGTGGLLYEGGTFTSDGHNIYSLVISDPAATFRLNKWNGTDAYALCHLVRYSATFQIRAGGHLRLKVDSQNDSEITNYPPQILTALAGEPEVMVSQTPYYDDYGQFLQLDSTAIALA